MSDKSWHDIRVTGCAIVKTRAFVTHKLACHFEVVLDGHVLVVSWYVVCFWYVFGFVWYWSGMLEFFERGIVVGIVSASCGIIEWYVFGCLRCVVICFLFFAVCHRCVFLRHFENA